MLLDADVFTILIAFVVVMRRMKSFSEVFLMLDSCIL